MRLKHFLSVFLTLLTLSVGQMWGAPSVVSYNESKKDTETSVTSSNITSGTAGRVSWSATGATWNSKKSRWDIAVDGTITFSVSSGYQITRIEFTTTSNKGTFSVSPTATITGNGSSPCTISGLSASSVTVTVSGQTHMINSSVTVTYEEASSSKTLSSISVQTAPTNKYVAGEMFDPTGLVITRTYSDATSDTYAYAGHTSDFTFSPTTSTALTTSNTSVSITYGGKSVSQSINVYNVTMQARDEEGNTIPAGGPGAPSRTGNSISPAADANNYVFKEWQKTNADLGSSATTKANTITNPTGAVTVTAVYYKPITITYKANGQDFTTQTYGYGGTLAFPASGPNGDTYSCTGKTFTGWVAEANKDYSNASTAPTYVTAGGSVTAAATYYAVFATSGGGSSNGSKTLVSSSSSTYYSTGHITGVSGTNKATWTADAFIMTQYKNTGNAVPLNYAEIRAYQYHSLEFTPASGTTISSIVVTANSNSYASALGGSSISNCTKSVSGSTVTITPTDGTTAITLVQSAQSRINSIVVNYTTGGGTTYSNYATTCCTPLGSINGSFNGTTQKVTWSAIEDANGYKVKVENASHQTFTDWTDINNTTEYSTAGLTCGGNTYYVYVKAYNTNNAGHCTGDGPSSNAIQVTSAACTEPEIIADPTSLTGLNYIVGAGPSTAKSFDVLGANLTGDLTVKANDNYEICLTNSATAADWKSGNTTLTIAKATAEDGQTVYVRLKSGKAVGDYNSNTIKVYGGGIEEASAATVTVSGSVLKPTITATPTSISDWSTQTGTAPSPATKTIAVTGSNLKADISASLTAGGDYFSIESSGLTQSEGSVTNGSVVISVKAAAYASAATREGTLRLSTTDGDNVDVAISLTVTDDPREKFTLLTSSNVGEVGDGTKLVLVYDDEDIFNETHTYYVMNSTQNGSNGHEQTISGFEMLENASVLAISENNPQNIQVLELVEVDDDIYALYTGSTKNTYLYNSGNKTLNEAANYTDTKAQWAISVNEGYAIIKAQGGNTQQIGYNEDAYGAKFRCYASGYRIYAYFKASTTPKVNISGTLESFTYMRDNGPSAAQLFKVRGNNLSENLVVTAPTNYEVCKTENGTYAASVEFEPAAGSVSQSDVYIRLKSGLAINTYNGDITVSSTGATNATKAVAGSVTTPVYTVTLNTNGGTIEDGHDVTSYTEGVGATLPTAEYISKSGYSFEGWFANSDLSTGGVQTTIGTNATGAKEYWAKWQELPGYDITWLVDGEAYTGGEPDVHVVYNGSISKLPSTPTSLDITSKTFVGWTTAPVNDKQTDAPSPLYTAANQIPGNITENKIFYAVFAQEVLSGTFTKVTAASTLAAGDRLLIHSNNYAAGTIGSNNYLTRESVAFTNDDITNKGNAAVWVLGGSSGEWTLASDEGTLKCYGTGNNNLSMSSGTDTWEITISSGNATIKPTNLETYIKYNSAGRFSSYASGQSAVQLYREGTSLNDYTTKFVKPVAVTGVTLNKNATTLAIGGTETLTATVAPANATNKNVSWTTSDGSIATVEAGVVTAVAAGEATITVTTEDGSFTDECVVTVLPTVETPTFSPAAGAINKGSKVTITSATDGATILYSLDGSDPSLAYPEGGVTINANCTLKAKATKANYTTSAVAQAAYTIIKATQTVSFAESAISFRLESDEYNAFTGQTASSTYGSAVITYASSNTSVAEVNTNTGAVTLQGVKGTTTITATAAEDDDYASAQETYTITVLRAGVVRTGDFALVTDASQLADGDYILLTSETRNGYENPDYASVFSGITSSAGTFQNKNVANEEITYAQLLTEGNTAKIIYLEKVTVGNIDYWAFNYGTESDIYIAALTNSSNGLNSEGSTSDYSLWSISIGANNVANVTNKGNSGHGVLSYNTQGSGAFKAYTALQTGSLRIYKQKDKNKLPQDLSFATASYEFPLNESAYTSFSHQTVSGAQTAVTYTSSNAEVAAIVENTVVLQGGVGTTTITATAAEDDDYEHASATYTITVTAALNTVTFHFYKAADATADQTALKELTSGAGITVPAKPADVGEYTFLGWASATLDETQTAPTNLVAALQAGATYHPSANGEEYFAIYRRLENSDGRFYLKHNSYYAQAPASSTSTNLQNTNKLSEAAVFGIDGDKFYYYEGSTKRYISSVVTSGSTSEKRVLSFTTDIDDAKAWTIVETATNITLQSSINNLYLYHNGNLWAAYASLTESETVTKDLTKVYLANVYYTSTPNKMVSPVLTWAQGNATHVMEIEATYDNAATATVGGEPVSVSYSSSDPEKATVSNAGVVTAIKGGLVTITATVAENPGVSRQLEETYQVSITKKVPQITFDNEANWKVYVGEAYKRVLAGQVTITTDGDVTYTLSNNATSSDWASINSGTGEVTGLSTGNQSSKLQYLYVHTAETDMYQSGEAYKQFNVLALKNQTLTFGQNAYVYEMNETVADFTNTLSGAQTTVTYASDNTDVAEVDEASGEVTVHTNVCGTATITATAAEGQVGDDVYKEVSQSYTIMVNYPMPTFSMESSNIKAPVSLAISGYDENTKLYWTDGEGDPITLYNAPIAINSTKTIRAKATNADGTIVSPIASVTLTKVVPSVNGSQEGGTITLNADEGSLITYIILNQNAVTVAEGTDVASPVVFNTELSGTYTVSASAKWDVENGFTSEDYDHDFTVKGKGHLPISYTGNGTNGIANEPWATRIGNVSNYNGGDIKFDGSALALIAAFVEKPIQLSYSIKHNPSESKAWTATENVYKVQWSADGETYTDIKVYDSSTPITTAVINETFDLDASARYIKWTYVTKDNDKGGNVALNNIRITCEAVVIDGTSVIDIPEGYQGDVIVEEGVTWVPVNNSYMPEVNNLWVKQGAIVDLDMAMLEVNDLRIEAMEGYSGQIREQDNFSITGNAYYDLTLNTSGTMDNSKWYAFAVPFQVDAATGIQRLSNDGMASPAGFNSHYVLLKYNSAAYASAGQGWEYVTAGETLMPGKFYMVALNSNAYNRLRMTKKAGTPVNNKADLTLTTVGAGLHANWNALANNALAYANVSATGDNASLKVQVYNSATDNYTALGFGDVTFTVGTPFFFQAAAAGTMSVNIAATNNPTVKAPALYTVTTEEFQIRLGENTESYYDILYVSASDEALNEYQIGHDLAKAGVSTTVPQMYVPAYGGKLCDAEFPLVNNEATFPLTFTAPNAGTYQLYISKAATDAELFLTKDGAIIWNLTMSAYALELEKGTTENYGLLLKVKDAATGVENSEVLNGANGVQKVIIDEHVFILRGGQMYDVTGKAVK